MTLCEVCHLLCRIQRSISTISKIKEVFNTVGFVVKTSVAIGGSESLRVTVTVRLVKIVQYFCHYNADL